MAVIVHKMTLILPIDFDIFKGFLIFTEFDKFASSAWVSEKLNCFGI